MSQLDSNSNADADPGDEDDGAIGVVYALLLDGVDSQGDLIDLKAFDEAARALAADTGDSHIRIRAVHGLRGCLYAGILCHGDQHDYSCPAGSR